MLLQDRKYNLGGCRSCKKFEGATPHKGRNVVSQKRVNIGWVNMSAYNFFVSGPKFTNFFRQIGDGM